MAGCIALPKARVPARKVVRVIAENPRCHA